MEHIFDVDEAEKYGIVEAVLIRHFKFWIVKNAANERNQHDDHVWTYSSIKALSLIFPYLSNEQIRYAIEKLIKKEVLITGNFNEHKYDRTIWYAFKDESFLEKYKIHLGKIPNAIDESATPIPDVSTGTSTDKNIYTEDTDSYKLASYLFKKISERNPGHKQPNMQQWCRHIDLMLRIDKRDKVEIAEVIKWCQQDTFWQNNILSTAKLREKYDQLNIKRKTLSQIKGSNLGQIDKAKYQRLADNPPKY